MKMFIDSSESGDYYLIDYDRADEWYEWLENYDGDCPDCASYIGGWSSDVTMEVTGTYNNSDGVFKPV